MATRHGVREILRLLLLQAAVLILIVALSLEQPVAEAALLYRVLACGFVVCCVLLVVMSLRTRHVLVSTVVLLVVFAGWMVLRGLLDVATTTLAAIGVGVALRRWLPPTPLPAE